MSTSDFQNYFYSITHSEVNYCHQHVRFALHTHLSNIKSTSDRDGRTECFLWHLFSLLESILYKICASLTLSTLFSLLSSPSYTPHPRRKGHESTTN